MATEYFNQMISKRRSREWFCTLWKPVREYMKIQNEFLNDEEFENAFLIRLSAYESFRDRILEFAEKHLSTKWAYAYHNRGVGQGSTVEINGVPTKIDLTFNVKLHEYCEHLHFVIKTENSITGSSLMKNFPFAHIDISKTGITNCANYLLHNTASSAHKQRVPKEDLYCSGPGEHGIIWFPLVNSQSYEVFIPDNILHYVYNENMLSLMDFVARFGHTVCNSNYRTTITDCIDFRKQHMFRKDHVREIFNLLPEHEKVLFLSRNTGADLIDSATLNFDSITEIRDEKTMYDFERIYIWWKCSTYPARYDMKQMLALYDLPYLIEVDRDREQYLQENEDFLKS